MPRWLVALMLGGSLVAFACNDETVEEVSKDVCYSGMRWIGDKRGSPEMFPGRDCVGCHIENDGPPLAIGGTIYPYVLGAPAVFDAQSGEHCFGIEGIQLTIEDAQGQAFDLTTNRAGNFYVEGNPDDFAKPFNVQIRINDVNPAGPAPQMNTAPNYGGCGRCHSPGAELNVGEEVPPDELVLPTARIGLPGFKPNGPDAPSVEDELKAFIAVPAVP